MKRSKDKQKIIDEIAARIVQSLKPDKVILFGSYAEGRSNPESDVDILVVTDKYLSIYERYSLSHKLFDDLPIAVQLILITPSRYAETKDVIGGIAYPASNRGRILYEK